MNVLNCECNDENGLSFLLLVDGEPLVRLIGSQDGGIPYYLLLTDDLPCGSHLSGEKDADIRIVAVCSCGEEGCGSTPCRILREGETVVFCDFYPGFSGKKPDGFFRFTRANYDAVVAEMAARASAYADPATRPTPPSGTALTHRPWRKRP